MHRTALKVKGLSKSYDKPLFRDLDMMVEVGERIAIIGPNGIGKTTLLRCLQTEIKPDSGQVKWSENADIGYFGQDHTDDFAEDASLYDWISQWRQEGDDEQAIRGTLGRLLFSKVESEKSVKVVSGGEQGRLLFGKLMLQKNNVLLMDEPTNHLDMESIESLNLALENYPGTLVFVSHDREFVSSLATRIIDMTPDGVNLFSGTYEEYLERQGTS
jgi:ATPase subunit of ABC transporter with duplicated ATPase domains